MGCGWGRRRWGGTRQIQPPIQRNHWGPLGFLLPGKISHAGWRLPGPLPSTQRAAGHRLTSSRARKEVGVWLHPALPSILPSHEVTSQTPVSSPHASLMVDISPLTVLSTLHFSEFIILPQIASPPASPFPRPPPPSSLSHPVS